MTKAPELKALADCCKTAKKPKTLREVRRAIQANEIDCDAMKQALIEKPKEAPIKDKK